MRTITMKFGGSSVGTTTALSQMMSIVLQEYERWDQLILVVSALEGVTDALSEAAQLARLANRRGYRRIVATIRTRHLDILEELPLPGDERASLEADIDQLLFDMLDICQSLSSSAAEDTLAQETIDSIVAVGERLAVRIVAALIRSSGLRCFALDTIDLVITDNHFGSANPDMAATQQRFNEFLRPMINRQIIPVLTGYIGGTADGRITTMGRGGSDYTAAIVAACTGSEEVWMWTDVGGMMSTDPHEIAEAQVIPEISYEEIAEMSYFGARIIHARMIGVLQEKRIPLRIRNIYRPQLPGTLIHRITRRSPTTLRAVTLIQGIGLYTNQSGSLHDIHRLIHDVVKAVTGLPANITICAQSSTHSFVCVVIPPSAGPDAINQAVHAFRRKLDVPNESRPSSPAWNVSQVSVLTVIGNLLSENPAVTGRVFAALDNLPLLAVSLGPSSSSLSLVLPDEHSSTALQRLHELIVSR